MGRGYLLGLSGVFLISCLAACQPGDGGSGDKNEAPPAATGQNGQGHPDDFSLEPFDGEKAHDYNFYLRKGLSFARPDNARSEERLLFAQGKELDPQDLEATRSYCELKFDSNRFGSRTAVAFEAGTFLKLGQIQVEEKTQNRNGNRNDENRVSLQLGWKLESFQLECKNVQDMIAIAKHVEPRLYVGTSRTPPDLYSPEDTDDDDDDFGVSPGAITPCAVKTAFNFGTYRKDGIRFAPDCTIAYVQKSDPRITIAAAVMSDLSLAGPSCSHSFATLALSISSGEQEVAGELQKLNPKVTVYTETVSPGAKFTYAPSSGLGTLSVPHVTFGAINGPAPDPYLVEFKGSVSGSVTLDKAAICAHLDLLKTYKSSPKAKANLIKIFVEEFKIDFQ